MTDASSPLQRTQSPNTLSRVASLVSNPPSDIHRYSHAKSSRQHPAELETARSVSKAEAAGFEYVGDNSQDTPSATSTVAPDGCTQVKEIDGDLVHIPDGGLRAWLVVAGACHILFSTFGFVVSSRLGERCFSPCLWRSGSKSGRRL